MAVRRVYIIPGYIGISSPGYDAVTAGDGQMLLRAGVKYPMQIIKAGNVAVPAASNATVLFPYDLGYVPVVFYQSSSGGDAYMPFAQLTAPTSGTDTPMSRVKATNYVNFFHSSPAARNVGYIVFRRPNSG